jgi:hypothetical protein
MLNVVILSVIMLNVATPCKLERKMFYNTSPGHLKFGSISRKCYNTFFSSSLMKRQNKLECLSGTSLSNLV